ncbi:MAG: ComEC/Rec2 family competence protein [bacterium]|nr:MAG: ComEC/Rec2 family competence protein [bacterium]
MERARPLIMASLPVMGVAAWLHPSRLAMGAAGFAAGLAKEALAPLRSELSAWVEKDLTLRGRLTGVRPTLYEGSEITVRVDGVLSEVIETVHFEVKAIVRKMPSIPAGSMVLLRASLERPPGRGKVTEPVRARLVGDGLLPLTSGPSLTAAGRRRLMEILDGSDDPLSGLLGAISLGERWRVDASLQNAMKRTGTYHFVAISGVHLAACLLVPVLLVRLAGSARGRGLTGWKALPGMAVGGAAGLLYLSFTGMSSSALRAGLFLFLTWAALPLGRHPCPRRVLSWCVLVIVLLERRQPDMALLLSALAVAGIVESRGGERGFFRVCMRAATGAILFTLPVAVWCARGVPLAAPLANTLAGPAFSLVLIPAAVLLDLASMIPRFPVKAAAGSWTWAAGPVMSMVGHLSSIPAAFLPLAWTGCAAVSVAGVAALICWWRRGFGTGTGLLLFLSAALAGVTVQQLDQMAHADRMTIHFPGIGQADGTIIRVDGRTVLVDCGPKGAPGRMAPVERALQNIGIARIDAIFLSHDHPDHVGGVGQISQRWPVGAIFLPGAAGKRWDRLLSTLPDGTRVQFVRAGRKVRVSTLDFEILEPGVAGPKNGDENAASLQLALRRPGFTALFTGDAPWDKVRNSLEKVGAIELLKLPHHGSGVGFPPEGLEDALQRPAGGGWVTVVCPSAPPGKGKLPSAKVVRWFRKAGFRLLFTGDGDIIMGQEGEGLFDKLPTLLTMTVRSDSENFYFLYL